MHQMKHRQMLRSLVGCDPQALWNVNLIIYTLFKLPGLFFPPQSLKLWLRIKYKILS